MTMDAWRHAVTAFVPGYIFGMGSAACFCARRFPGSSAAAGKQLHNRFEPDNPARFFRSISLFFVQFFLFAYSFVTKRHIPCYFAPFVV